MRTTLLVIAVLALLAGTLSDAHSRQLSRQEEPCEEFDQYARAMLSAGTSFWWSMHEAGLAARDPNTLADDEWFTRAELTDRFLATIGQIQPPDGVADWHEVEVRHLETERNVAEVAAASGVAAATEQFREDSDTIAAEASVARERATEACPQFSAFHEDWADLGQPVELIYLRIVVSLEEQGVTPNPAARERLFEVAQQAADYIASQPDKATAWQEVSTDIDLIVEAIVANAMLQGDRFIGVQGVTDILKPICPIWLICE